MESSDLSPPKNVLPLGVSKLSTSLIICYTCDAFDIADPSSVSHISVVNGLVHHESLCSTVDRLPDQVSGKYM